MTHIIRAKHKIPGSSLLRGLGALVFFLGFGGYIVYKSGILGGDVGASAVLNPFGEVRQSALAPIPKIEGYNEIVWKVQEMKLTSFVSLPVLGGKKGRKNPFEDFRPPQVQEEGGQNGSLGNGEGAISQGSK